LSLKLAYYIAKKVRQKGGSSYSGFIIKIAQAATALSVAIMIISVAIVMGFKNTIRDKLFVFWGHVQITQYQPDPTIGI
jgi:lipoprotein-releasing system permease protein